jgi:hypothetical protein
MIRESLLSVYDYHENDLRDHEYENSSRAGNFMIMGIMKPGCFEENFTKINLIMKSSFIFLKHKYVNMLTVL